MVVASGRGLVGRSVPSFLHLSQAWREHIKWRRRERRARGEEGRVGRPDSELERFGQDQDAAERAGVGNLNYE